jgi:endonuclease/exonuclease/phosphatase family metal-dependent hydrolase
MSFSFLCWNVRHYRGDADRLKDAENLIRDLDPDIFGLLEFEVKLKIDAPGGGHQNTRADMRKLMFERFADYDFVLTDSSGGMEVLVGYRRGKFPQVVTSQRREFNDKLTLRPGSLVSVRHQDQFYSLLFLHLKSGRGKNDIARRKKMYTKIDHLNAALANIADNGKPNLIALGDFNTMGQSGGINGKTEIADLSTQMQAAGLNLLDKDRPSTWSKWGNGPRWNRTKLSASEADKAFSSNLDHVVVSEGLELAEAGLDGSPIHVRGWHQTKGQAKADFLWDLSDHCAVYGKVRT